MSDGSPKHSKSGNKDPLLATSSVKANHLTTTQQHLQHTSFPFTTRELLCEDEMHEVLQLSSSQISQATASNASALVQLSNSEKSHERLHQLLPLYFYSWNLTNSHAVIVFLLLHYFLLKREHKEALGAKGLYEEHIALLKNRMSDLEEKLSNSHSHHLSNSSSGSRDGNANGGDHRPVGDHDECLAEVESLRSRVESLRVENEQLKHSNEEVCRINEQWALDYQSLSDQVKNATGFYSVQSGNSSRQSSARASPVPPSMCLQCAQMELQLEAKQDEIRVKERQVEDVMADLRKCEMRLERKDKDIERLTNDNQAIIIQLQELGDLQAAVKMKHDYRKLQYQLSQTNKQYQEAVSEKLQFQKQVDKLRQAFLGIFPFPNVAPQNIVQSTSEGYSSFPMRTCRRQHFNQYPFSDPAPPTPPGLIARGDHHGSLVEKDRDEQSSLPSQAIHASLQKPHPSDDQLHQTQSLRPLPLSHDSHVTSVIANKPHDYQRAAYSSNKSELHVSHMTNKQLTIPESGQPTTYIRTPSLNRPSSSNSTYESSPPNPTTSDYSSSKSLSQLILPTPSSSSSSQQTSLTGYSSAHTTSSGLSSGSGGTGTMAIHHAPPMITATTSLAMHPHYSRNIRMESVPRPSSLSLNVPRGQGSSTTASHHSHQQKMPNHQKFECPSCRKQFPYGPKDFDHWFEHIRYCENKPN